MPRDYLNPPSATFRFVTWVGAIALASPAVAFFFIAEPGATAEQQLLRIGVRVLSVASAALWLMVRGLRHELDVMDDLLSDVRFGKGTKRDRDAVDILIRALRAPDGSVKETALRSLRKITGHDLGDDAAAWEGWWAGARSTFSRSTAGKNSPDPS